MGSDALATVYADAFNLSQDKMLSTGIPRTDLFFDKMKKKQIINNFLNENQFLREKKINIICSHIQRWGDRAF